MKTTMMFHVILLRQEIINSRHWFRNCSLQLGGYQWVTEALSEQTVLMLIGISIVEGSFSSLLFLVLLNHMRMQRAVISIWYILEDE
ncbi:uncharacterized protein G2W53_005423 [Senna tora]|uniref:Uncharacterized protein n=1 Tax=Senna tora TaxID=362788 RepID=A0A835CCT3_9FABA|nr:uncharacterized protein G2W53_005423 [Senna tora]